MNINDLDILEESKIIIKKSIKDYTKVDSIETYNDICDNLVKEISKLDENFFEKLENLNCSLSFKNVIQDRDITNLHFTGKIYLYHILLIYEILNVPKYVRMH